MDVDGGEPDSAFRSGESSPVVDGGDLSRDEKEEGEGEGESKSLLAVNGRAGAGKRQRSARRKVQWNDRHGNKLVEVLEFQPSDTSDSDEDDHADSCSCSIM